MSKDVSVSDGEYYLVRFTEEEKENYMRLMFPENKRSAFYQKEENRELFWRVTRNLKELDYSIYSISGEYCGNLELKKYDTTTPEIGIALLEEHRNKGIAGRTIKMLAKKYYEETEGIEYFVLKVSSYNSHSKHMIEKLGAEFAGEEETIQQATVRMVIEESGVEYCDAMRKEYQIEYGLSLEEQEEVVYVYHMLPDSFL